MLGMDEKSTTKHHPRNIYLILEILLPNCPYYQDWGNTLRVNAAVEPASSSSYDSGNYQMQFGTPSSAAECPQGKVSDT
jgi:hypothetical protein